MTWIAKTLHVTPKGRAKDDGSRVTRRSTAVRQTKYAKGPGSDRPLDFERACHPIALTPTPQHPQCLTRHVGFDVSRFSELSSLDFLTGVQLVRTSRGLGNDWLLVRRKHSAVPLGFASTHAALSYRRAAAEVGVELECYRDV
jgi:hypothetical protein